MRKGWLLLLATAAGAAAFQGYTDTPFIPGTTWRVHDATRPQPKAIDPGDDTKAPSDAIVLFNGTNTDEFLAGNGPAKWPIEEGAMVVKGGGSHRSKRSFGDIQLHLEFATPNPPRGSDQGRGNSGVYFMGMYEVQILDSYENKTYADGGLGSMYGQYPPLVNAARKPGEWQSYDIIFHAPTFKDGAVEKKARVTVLLNGILVQDNMEYNGPSAHRSVVPYREHAAKLPFSLQDHGKPVKFRNIWVREL